MSQAGAGAAQDETIPFAEGAANGAQLPEAEEVQFPNLPAQQDGVAPQGAAQQPAVEEAIEPPGDETSMNSRGKVRTWLQQQPDLTQPEGVPDLLAFHQKQKGLPAANWPPNFTGAEILMIGLESYAFVTCEATNEVYIRSDATGQFILLDDALLDHDIFPTEDWSGLTLFTTPPIQVGGARHPEAMANYTVTKLPADQAALIAGDQNPAQQDQQSMTENDTESSISLLSGQTARLVNFSAELARAVNGVLGLEKELENQTENYKDQVQYLQAQVSAGDRPPRIMTAKARAAKMDRILAHQPEFTLTQDVDIWAGDLRRLLVKNRIPSSEHTKYAMARCPQQLLQDLSISEETGYDEVIQKLKTQGDGWMNPSDSQILQAAVVTPPPPDKPVVPVATKAATPALSPIQKKETKVPPNRHVKQAVKTQPPVVLRNTMGTTGLIPNPQLTNHVVQNCQLPVVPAPARPILPQQEPDQRAVPPKTQGQNKTAHAVTVVGGSVTCCWEHHMVVNAVKKPPSLAGKTLSIIGDPTPPKKNTIPSKSHVLVPPPAKQTVNQELHAFLETAKGGNQNTPELINLQNQQEDLEVERRIYLKAQSELESQIQVGSTSQLQTDLRNTKESIRATNEKLKSVRFKRVQAITAAKAASAAKGGPHDLANSVGHPSRGVRFDNDQFPFFDAQGDMDPVWWEKRVRKLALVHNITNPDLVSRIETRLSAKSLAQVREAYTSTGQDVSNVEDWFPYFHKIFNMDRKRPVYRNQFETMMQGPGQSFQSFWSRLTLAHQYGWPNTDLDFEKDRLKMVVFRYVNGMNPGPAGAVAGCIKNSFLMQGSQWADLTKEEVGSRLVAASEDAWEIASQEAGARNIDLTGRNPKACNFCSSMDHMARDCPVAKLRRDQTAKLADLLMGEMQPGEIHDIDLKVLRGEREVMGRQPVLDAQGNMPCWECGSLDHRRRDCSMWIAKMEKKVDAVHQRSQSRRRWPYRSSQPSGSKWEQPGQEDRPPLGSGGQRTTFSTAEPEVIPPSSTDVAANTKYQKTPDIHQQVAQILRSYSEQFGNLVQQGCGADSKN